MDRDSAEARIRAALASGEAPAAADVAELVAELDRVRAESAERWQAIGRLAPAAKHHRARREAQERALGALGQHVEDLAARLEAARPAEAAPLDREALAAWVREARALLARAAES